MILITKEVLFLLILIAFILMFFKEVLLVITIFTVIGLKSGLKLWFEEKE
jgi:hypothetical protein